PSRGAIPSRILGLPSPPPAGLPMTTEPPPAPGFRSEFRLILRRAAQVWRLVPRSRKFSLVCSTVLMSVSAACGTMVALLLGQLLDQIKRSADEGLRGTAL